MEDLAAGFQRNALELSERSYRIDWKSTPKLSSEYLKSVSQVHKKLSEMQGSLKDQGAKEFHNAVMNSFSPMELSKTFENKKDTDGFGQFLNTSKGSWYRVFVRDPGELPGSLSIDAPEDANVSVSTFVMPVELDYFGIENLDQRTKLTHFSVLPLHKFKETVTPFTLPFPLPSDCKLRKFASSYTDILFPVDPNEARSTAKIDVTVEGHIAVVRISDLENMDPKSSDKWNEGRVIYAELEMDKGFLPRVIKTSRVAWHDGQLLDKLSKDFWFKVMEFENEELESGVFTHKSIKMSNFALIFSDRSTERFINEYQTYNVFLLGSDLDSIGTGVLADENKIELTSQMVDSDAFDSYFSLDEKSGVTRFYDARNGVVKVNSTIDKSLDLDLNTFKATPDNGNDANSTPPNNTTWILWGVLAIVSAFGIWWARR